MSSNGLQFARSITKLLQRGMSANSIPSHADQTVTLDACKPNKASAKARSGGEFSCSAARCSASSFRVGLPYRLPEFQTAPIALSIE